MKITEFLSKFNLSQSLYNSTGDIVADLIEIAFKHTHGIDRNSKVDLKYTIFTDRNLSDAYALSQQSYGYLHTTQVSFGTQSITIIGEFQSIFISYLCRLATKLEDKKCGISNNYHPALIEIALTRNKPDLLAYFREQHRTRDIDHDILIMLTTDLLDNYIHLNVPYSVLLAVAHNLVTTRQFNVRNLFDNYAWAIVEFARIANVV